jgi:hypothetical protein
MAYLLICNLDLQLRVFVQLQRPASASSVRTLQLSVQRQPLSSFATFGCAKRPKLQLAGHQHAPEWAPGAGGGAVPKRSARVEKTKLLGRAGPGIGGR